MRHRNRRASLSITQKFKLIKLKTSLLARKSQDATETRLGSWQEKISFHFTRISKWNVKYSPMHRLWSIKLFSHRRWESSLQMEGEVTQHLQSNIWLLKCKHSYQSLIRENNKIINCDRFIFFQFLHQLIKLFLQTDKNLISVDTVDVQQISRL